MASDQDFEKDGWLRATRYVLIFVGVCYLPLIGLGPYLASTKFNDPKMPADFNRGFGIVFTLVIAVVCVGVAALNFAAAWGLARGKRWAWTLSVILGALYAASICLPFGAVILYGLLRDKVRNLYLVKPAATE